MRLKHNIALIVKHMPCLHGIAAAYADVTGNMVSGVRKEDFLEALKCYAPYDTMSLSSTQTSRLYRDYVCCKLDCGIALEHYFVFEFYNKTRLEQQKYITNRQNLEFHTKYNHKEYTHFMADKVDFDVKFSHYLCRDWMPVNSDDYSAFLEFCHKHKEIMVKPKDGERGMGVYKAIVSSDDLIKVEWERLKANNYVVEEVVNQHPEMAKYHPSSLNTVRVSIALNKKGIPTIVVASMRSGQKGNVIDNAHGGGLVCGIDLSTGKLKGTAFDTTAHRFEEHPTTHIVFDGQKIPKWEELKKLALEVAVIIPELKFIGWDWALNDRGEWLLIEGNEPGCCVVTQGGAGRGLLNDYQAVWNAE